MTRKFNGWRVFLTASLLWLSVFGGLAFWESGRQVTGLAALESAGRFSLYWAALLGGGVVLAVALLWRLALWARSRRRRRQGKSGDGPRRLEYPDPKGRGGRKKRHA